MSSIATLEAKLIESLKSLHAPEHFHAAAIKLRKEAGDLARRGRHAKAAAIYAALGRQHSTNIELLLRTARSFHKASCTDCAAA